MFEFYKDVVVRIAHLAIPIFLATFQKKSVNDWFIYSYLCISLAGEIFSFFQANNNIFMFSILGLVQTSLVVVMTSQDTKKNWIKLWILPSLLLFLSYIFTDFSLFGIFGDASEYDHKNILNVQEYFDLFSVYNFTLVVLMFYWLNNTIEFYKEGGVMFRKKLINIFAFLFFYAGTFFAIAFGRYVLPNLEAWFRLWEMLYHPILIIFLTTISINLFWKPQPS